MDDAARGEGKCSGARAQCAITDLKGQLAFENIKRFVLALMHMRRLSASASHRLDFQKSVGPARVLRGGFERVFVASHRNLSALSRSQQNDLSDCHFFPLL